MKQKELKISGMTCRHCIASVKEALEQLPGVEVQEVQIGRASIRYDETTVSESALAAAIAAAGYTMIDG
jgi:copper chaperone CopZ